MTSEQLPPDFLAWAMKRFGPEFSEFAAALVKEPTTSVRFNPGKNTDDVFYGDPVPWSENAIYLEQRPHFALDPLWHAGAYYVQEASSMLISNSVKQLDLPESPLVLDMCAAPGGKSTLLIDLLPQDGILVANEVIRTRFPILVQNLERWGDPKVFASQSDPSFYGKAGPLFDLILVDAPCSGEGLFRKDKESSTHWSLENVRHCSIRQSRILEEADRALKPGGYLIYSTCTYNEQENFAPLVPLVSSGNYDPMVIKVDPDWGITKLSQEGILGLACYPHKVRGEGFFHAVLKKNGSRLISHVKPAIRFLKDHPWPSNWLPKTDGKIWQKNELYCIIPSESESAFQKLASILPRLLPLGKLGRMKGKDAVPEHNLAQLRYNQGLPGIDLPLELALKFLRKDPELTIDAQTGWHVVQYKGLGLGWVKRLPNRINNYYPTEYRLRMRDI